MRRIAAQLCAAVEGSLPRATRVVRTEEGELPVFEEPLKEPTGEVVVSQVDEEAERLAFQKYCEEGKARALALGNRGPIRYGPDGKLAKEILDSYYEHGFYVLQGVIKGEELREIQESFEELLENAPSAKGSKVDKHGRPVKHPKVYQMGEPLTDNAFGARVGIWDWKKNAPYLDKWGKTYRNHLHMREPTPPEKAPETVPTMINHAIAFSDAALRIYGHPDLLRVAEALSGPDMTPFSENFYAKQPFLGTSTSWHQDPSSAWDTEGWGTDPNWDLGTVGFNYHLSIYHGTPEQSLWVLPGSARMGRVDMESLSASVGGTDRLPGAVPVLCEPGDVYIQSRLALHGAFPNQSPDFRATFQWGFHRKSTVLNKTMYKQVYTEDYLRKRQRMIQLAIDARRQKYPEEKAYVYQPFVGHEDECRWDATMKERQYGVYPEEHWKNGIAI